MITNGVVRSSCDMCSSKCGVLVHVVGARVAKVEGDPESPINRGALCPKGAASLEYLYHPNRLRHPLRRAGERGHGNWEQISWDEALDTIASELVKARDSYGAESVALIMGANRGLRDSCLERFANVFGTPNVTGVAHVCFHPRRLASIITCGFNTIPDYDFPPSCLVMWGANVVETRLGEYAQTTQALNKGTKLIVIDPRKTEFATKADLWVQLRPASDLALALAMINVIVNESLFDKAFVDNWTVGFDELKAHVQQYSPEKVEDITWVPAGTIREAARFYAEHRPACIQLGNALEHNINSFQVNRAVSILRAITGNLGVPGGDAHWALFDVRFTPGLTLQDKMPVDMWQRRLGADLRLLPAVRRVCFQNVTKAILKGSPYPIHVAYVQGGNPLLTHSDAFETYRALKKLDFIAVAELFMTPTAALADIILPVATFLEFDSVVTSPYSPVIQVQQKVVEIPECWPDSKIVNHLAKRVGLGEYFWDGDEEQLLNDVLKPFGLTFEEFRQVGVITVPKQYRKYQLTGFETPSRKVELYSNQLKEWGVDPLPVYYEPPETPYSDPELAKEYPLIFTSLKPEPYRHSTGRQIPSLRNSHPEPITTIHPQTAKELGIEEGDWVYIETKRGRIKQKVALSDSIDPRVVVVDYAWWFPEKGASSLYGYAESNLNMLTDNKPPYGREVGAANLRGMLCKVYKVP